MNLEGGLFVTWRTQIKVEIIRNIDNLIHQVIKTLKN